MTGLPASESREITEHRPRDFQANLRSPESPISIISGISGISGMASLLAKSMRKLTRKSIQNRSQQRSRGTQNRVKIAPGTLSGHPVVPKSVPEVSREHLRSFSGRPRCAPGAPGESPRASRNTKKSARELPGARRGHQNRRQVSSGSEKIEFCSRDPFAAHRRSDFVNFCRFAVFFRFMRVKPDPHETS